jgi:hypothetical protein
VTWGRSTSSKTKRGAKTPLAAKFELKLLAKGECPRRREIFR